jgi:peroxiredoxin Q/BCP
MLKAGSRAPDFEIFDDHGDIFRLNDFAGKSVVVLFFFPKADTPG